MTRDLTTTELSEALDISSDSLSTLRRIHAASFPNSNQARPRALLEHRCCALVVERLARPTAPDNHR